MVWSLCCSGNVKMEIRRATDPSKTQVDLTSIRGATTNKHLYDTDVDELVDDVGKISKGSNSGTSRCFKGVMVSVNTVLGAAVVYLIYVVICMQHEVGLVKTARTDVDKCLNEVKTTHNDVDAITMTLHKISNDLTNLTKTTNRHSKDVDCLQNTTTSISKTMISFNEKYAVETKIFHDNLDNVYKSLHEVQVEFKNESKLLRSELIKVKNTSAQTSSKVISMSEQYEADLKLLNSQLNNIALEFNIVKKNFTTDLTYFRQEFVTLKTGFEIVKEIASDANAAVERAEDDIRSVRQVLKHSVDETKTELKSLTKKILVMESNWIKDVQVLQNQTMLTSKELAAVNGTLTNMITSMEHLKTNITNLVESTIKDAFKKMIESMTSSLG